MRDELLTIPELAEFLKLDAKSVSNMISRGVFVQGVHFVRPRGLGTRFKRSAIEKWLHGDDEVKASGMTFPVKK